MMDRSESDTDAASHKEDGGRRPLWQLVVLVAVLLPSFVILSNVALLVATGSLDVAHGLGVSDGFLNGLLVASSGVLAGLFGGGVAGIRGWKMLVPGFAGGVVGLAIFLPIAASGYGELLDNHLGLLVTLWIGQTAAIVLATRLRPVLEDGSR